MSFEKILKFLLKSFLFLLPWQTIWIFREVFVGGVKMEYLTLGFFVTEVLLWIVVAMFIGWYWREKKLRNLEIKKFSFSKDRIFVFSVLLFIIYCLLSRFWSLDGDLAMQQSLHILEAFLLFFILLLGPLKKEQAIKWLALGSILPCVLGIWQFLTQSTFASTLLGLASHPAWQAGTSVVASETIGRWLRAYGTFSHPNVFGGYIVIVLLLAYHITQTTKPKFYSVLCCLGFVFLAALFFTFSRSAWMAAAVVCILYPVSCILLFCHHNYNRLQVTGYMLQVTLVLILVALFFPLVQTRLTGNSISETRSMTDRVSGYSEAWKIFKQNPILGVGAGNYTVAVWHSDKWRPAWEIQPAHNVFVLFAVEFGVVGIILCLLVLISFVKLITQTTKHTFYFMLCCLSFVFLLSSDHYLYSSYIGLMLSALFFGLISRKSNENTVSPQLVHS